MRASSPANSVQPCLVGLNVAKWKTALCRLARRTLNPGGNGRNMRASKDLLRRYSYQT
jgi:hypothetical protein